ncbi:MAG: hypothetical protein Q4E28_05035 [Clostridia bacterium]|nr:hypothetical protein [Clostridia bacterium]
MTFLEQLKESVLFLFNKEIERKDFVVEVGEKDGWTYRKWKSGIKECWIYYTETKTSQTWSGAGLTNANRYSFTKTLPTKFFVNPVSQIKISGSIGNGYGFPIFVSQENSSAFSFVMTSNSSGSQLCRISIYCIGE